jgi:hypothetical protein
LNILKENDAIIMSKIRKQIKIIRKHIINTAYTYISILMLEYHQDGILCRPDQVPCGTYNTIDDDNATAPSTCPPRPLSHLETSLLAFLKASTFHGMVFVSAS